MSGCCATNTTSGYGAALRTGFAAARFERVAFTDADCQFHLADLGRLLSLSDRYPLVVGWRESRQDSWRRRFLSRGYNLLTRTLLGTRVRDCDCALKVFQRDALASLVPETNTFFVNAEMLTKACHRGMEVAEVGVRHRPRLRGASKVSLLEVPRILATLLPFWWSRVLFAGDATATSPERQRQVPEPRRWRSGVVCAMLMVLAATLFLLRLRAPLLEPQEPRYAEIPRQMMQEGRLLVPVLHGQPYLDKPPLLYWLVMGSYAVFGVHDWAARLIPGLAGILTVLLTYAWGRRVVGERAGLCGALVLCLSAGFVYRERMLNMDSLLCLWVTAALAAAHAALTAGPGLRWRWWLAAAVACGLGLLTKGPIALVLVLAPLLVYPRLEPRCARVSLRATAALVLVAVAMAAPWYVAVMVQEPGFARSFFWRHHVVRFLMPFDHEKPAWFYLPGLLAGMLAVVAAPAGICALPRPPLAAGRSAPTGRAGLSPLIGSLGSAILLGLGLQAARVHPAGDAAARPGPGLLSERPGAARSPPDRRGLARPVPLALRAPRGRRRCWYWPWRSAVVTLAGYRQMLRPQMVLMLGALAAVGLVLAHERRFSWGGCAAVTFLVLGLGVFYLQPAYNRQFALGSHLRSDCKLAGVDHLPVVCYPQRWDSVSFYLPRADVRVYTLEQRQQLLVDLRSRPRTLLLVKSGKVLDALLREMPESMEFVAHGRPGIVTAGWVRPRPEPPGASYACR
jgi:dolichol-phosphate mannosyltransferase